MRRTGILFSPVVCFDILPGSKDGKMNVVYTHLVKVHNLLLPTRRIFLKGQTPVVLEE